MRPATSASITVRTSATTTPPKTSRFTGTINWVQLDQGDDNHDHLISPEDRLKVAMRGWVHDFAAGVIRPAGSEWDEREETPWPILEEAAKIGLYSLDFFAQQAFEASRPGVAARR